MFGLVLKLFFHEFDKNTLAQNTSALVFYFTYNSSALVGSKFGAIWVDPEGGFIKFAVKQASKQDQILHMEGKFRVIFYFMVV